MTPDLTGSLLCQYSFAHCFLHMNIMASKARFKI